MQLQIATHPSYTPSAGVKGAYYGGHWIDIEDCAGAYQPDSSKCSGGCPTSTCPRSRSRNATSSKEEVIYDVVIIGAGCIGGAVARELSRKFDVYDCAMCCLVHLISHLSRSFLINSELYNVGYKLKTLLLESADDVSQGATKGNSGIVHAG